MAGAPDPDTAAVRIQTAARGWKARRAAPGLLAAARFGRLLFAEEEDRADGMTLCKPCFF